MKHKTHEISFSLPEEEFRLNLALMPNGDWSISPGEIARVGRRPVRKLFELAGELESLSALASRSQLYSLPLAVTAWQYWAEKGNTRCAALVGALAIEALERRADHVAGIQRSEQERDERLATSFKEIRELVWMRLKEQSGLEISTFHIDEPDVPVPSNHPKFKKVEYRQIEDVIWFYNPRTDAFSVSPNTYNRKDYELWESLCGFYGSTGCLDQNMKALKGLRAIAKDVAPQLMR